MAYANNSTSLQTALVPAFISRSAQDPMMAKYLFVSLLLVFVASCTSVEKQPIQLKAEKLKFEPRESLINWYNATHKSYYGIKGPVKTLIASPIVNAENPAQVSSDGWELHFNKLGYLLRKKRIGDDQDFETTYAYSEDSQLKYIASHLDGKPWRTSTFIYEKVNEKLNEKDRLVRVDFIDHVSGDRHSLRNSRQNIINGWFEVQSPVEKTELPSYTEFAADGSLLWSNKGDINNGLGEQYYLRTVDNVTSSSVLNQGTEQMAGRGGYRYHYDKNGLLKSVESFNAHNNRLFHTTSYQYDAMWLLSSEQKKVSDTSPFNQAIDERVDYLYQLIDEYGNWLERKIYYKSKFQSLSYLEKRTITYYQ